jgi:flagella basal body P-ring formation protein FlgA
MRLIGFALFACLTQFFSAPVAQAALPPDIEASIKRFIQKSPSVNGLRVEIEFNDSNQTFPACLGGTIEVASPPGVNRLWGRTTVQVRCAKAAWMINVPVNIRAFGDYVVAGRYLPMGQRIEMGDIRVIEGDLSTLPDDVLRSPKASYERILVRPVQMGSPIGLNDLKESSVIKIGDPVRIQLIGKDFQVSGEGTAQTAGLVGDMVRIRLLDGQILQGKVLRPGVVGINME